MEPIGLKVNGDVVSVTAEEQIPLLDILRNHLGLMGTKIGCGLEQCGACTVLVDGRPEKSCGKPLSAVVDKEIVDELAERAGTDPVACRLSILSDSRAHAIVEHAARLADWKAGLPPGTGQGRWIGFARYKNLAAYAAVEAEVDEVVPLLGVWCAADAGLVINPDGALNQLEGGIIQAASWALKDGVRLDTGGISSRDWDSYLVLRFSEAPEVLVELVDPSADLPPLGVGEVSGGPTFAAIGHAVAHPLVARRRDLPLTRDCVMAGVV